MDIQKTRTILGDRMRSAVESDKKGIYLIRAQTALGKTHTYCQIIKENAATKFMVVVPTIKLQEEVGATLENLGVPVFLTVNLNSLLKKLHLEDLNTEVEALYQRGFGFMVKSMIRNYIEENKMKLGRWQLEKLDEYLRSGEKLDGTSCVVTTHSMFLSIPEEKIRKYEVIVDEDILMTIFKNTASISFEELKLSLGAGAIQGRGIDFVQKMLQSKDGVIIKAGPKELSKRQQQDIYEKDLQIHASLVDFLLARTYHVDVTNERVNYFLAKQLPDVKMIIVSAILNEDLYKSYCRGREIFKDTVPAVKYKGKLEQYTAHPMSRSNIDKIGFWKIMKKVDKLVGNPERKVITFKKYIPHAEIYYGKTEGYNEYKGMDLAVIGTPHNVPFVYYLIGAYLGYQTRDSMGMRLVENETYSFPFMTFKDEQMRNLQFYFIESEMEQAIGRARLLSYDCTVRLFSNYPCRQAHLIGDDYMKG